VARPAAPSSLQNAKQFHSDTMTSWVSNIQNATP
jgi:hypothetical protein